MKKFLRNITVPGTIDFDAGGKIDYDEENQTFNFTVDGVNALVISDADTGLSLGSSAYTDLALNIYAQNTVSVTWTIYAVAATAASNIIFTKMGRLVVAQIAPFTISGTGTGNATILIDSDGTWPTDFLPAAESVFGAINLVDTGANILSCLRYTDDTTIRISAFDSTDTWTGNSSGTVALSLPYDTFVMYVAAA